MVRNQLVIRAMTIEDLDAIVPLHRAAFAGTLGVSLGQRYSQDFINWFITSSEATKIVCERDSHLVGYVFGAPTGYANEINRTLMPVIILSVLLHPWVIADRRFFRQIPARMKSMISRNIDKHQRNRVGIDESQAEYRLVGIGVDPTCRKTGIGRKLIESYEEAVWALGYNTIGLSVYTENLAAQRLYESCNWKALPSKGTIVSYMKTCGSSENKD